MTNIFPTLDTKTLRRNVRREIRNLLGTSRDPAPSGDRVFRAVEALDTLLNLSTNGRYTLLVRRRWNGENTDMSVVEAKAEARQVGFGPDW